MVGLVNVVPSSVILLPTPNPTAQQEAIDRIYQQYDSSITTTPSPTSQANQ